MTALLMSLLACVALLLTGLGATVIRRGVVRPLHDIGRVIETVANGASAITIPYGNRPDEIGALSRAIAVFQAAMLKTRS